MRFGAAIFTSASNANNRPGAECGAGSSQNANILEAAVCTIDGLWSPYPPSLGDRIFRVITSVTALISVIYLLSETLLSRHRGDKSGFEEPAGQPKWCYP
jgi:hypothetical protein